MGDINREMLLGYLMNALEDDEITRVEREMLRRPELRVELANLQEEISPLNFVYETVDPPPNLARRTCDKIWAHVDREERIGNTIDKTLGTGPVISLSLPQPHFGEQHGAGEARKVNRHQTDAETPDRSQVLEEIVAASSHLPEEMPKRLARRDEKKRPPLRKSENSASGKRRSARQGRWIDVLAAVGVGVLIALVVFPALNFTKDKVHSYIVDHKLRTIDSNTEMTPMPVIAAQAMAAEGSSVETDIFHYGWQEIKPDRIPLLVADAPPAVPTESTNEPESVPVDSETLFAESQPMGNGVILGQSGGNSNLVFGPTQQIDISDPGNVSGRSIFSNVGQLMPVSNSPMLQTTYGQNVIFHNGKIFVRRFPVAPPTE